jgi:hypothetical protein
MGGQPYHRVCIGESLDQGRDHLEITLTSSQTDRTRPRERR